MSLLPKSVLAGIRWPSFTSSRHVQLFALQSQMDQTQWLPSEQLLALQFRQIQKLIDYAAREVPFYQDRLTGLVGLPAGRLNLPAFRQLPLLTRSDIQTADRRMVSANLPPDHGDMIQVQTSGSTGRPVRTMATALTAAFYQALGLRFHLWHQRDLTGKNMSIRTPRKLPQSEPGWVPGYESGPTCRFDIRRPTRELFNLLIKEDPHYLQTQPNALLALLEHSQDSGLRPSNLREVRTFGEPLTDEIRDLAGTVWNVPIADNYSASEIGIIALQCPETHNLHIQAENLLVEVLDNAGSPCAPGQSGRVVVTDLHNFATPLIRYEIGDLAEVAAPCSCGRTLLPLRRICGRARNLLVLPSGDRMLPVFDSKRLTSAVPIRQYQVTQRTLHEIEVRLVLSRDATLDDELRLTDYFNELFGRSFCYEFVYCDEIARGPAGKFEVFQSEVRDEETRTA